MKIKLISRMAGPDGNYAAGSVIEFPADTAVALVAGGYATSLEEPKDQEADEPTPAKPRTRRKG